MMSSTAYHGPVPAYCPPIVSRFDPSAELNLLRVWSRRDRLVAKNSKNLKLRMEAQARMARLAELERGRAVSEIKHTPGPWISAPYSSVVGAPVVASSGRPVASVTYFAPNHDSLKNHDLQSEANGRLIAAAPDLLATMCQCADIMRNNLGRQDEKLVDVEPLLRAAIAKATGEAP